MKKLMIGLLLAFAWVNFGNFYMTHLDQYFWDGHSSSWTYPAPKWTQWENVKLGTVTPEENRDSLPTLIKMLFGPIVAGVLYFWTGISWAGTIVYFLFFGGLLEFLHFI